MTHDVKVGLLLSSLYQIILTTLLFFFFFSHLSSTHFTFERFFRMWDANLYIDIAEHGYQTTGEALKYIVFFPLYPLLIRVGNFFTQSYIVSGFLITALSSIAGHTILYLLLRAHHFSQKESLRIFLLFLVSPMCVYFSVLYTESLFLFLSTLMLLLLQKKKFFFAAIIGGCASLTRVVGVTLLIPYIFSVWKEGTKREKIKRAFYAILIPAGFGIYLLVNQILFHSPFFYQTVLHSNWSKSIVNPITQYVYIAQAFFQQRLMSYPTVLHDVLSTLLFPFVILFYLFVKRDKKLPQSWMLWSVSMWLIVCAQSFWLSNARYLFIIFPMFIMLEKLTYRFKLPYILLLLFFGYLAIHNIESVSLGQWVY
jgi:Gpi18-like mannosyltransferase